jgi:PAS domain S-box-containing protein
VILVAAADDGPERRLRGLELGAADLITRPFHEAELAARIAPHLRLQELSGRLQRQAAEPAAHQSSQGKRKQAEASLRLARFTLDRLGDAVYWMDSEGLIVDVNEGACRMLGYARAELIGRTVFDIDPDFTVEAWQQSWETLNTIHNIAIRTRHRASDGRIIPVEVVANIIDFDGVKLDCAVVRDITGRQQVEAELRASEIRYRALVESQVDLISRYLPDTTLTFVNDAYCQFYGKSRQELIGQSFLNMVATEFHQQAWEETQSFLVDPRPISGEYVNLRADGKACWIHWIIRGIVDETGRVAEIQATGRDITRLKEADQQLKDSLHEKEVLLKELHHRVKNNLQVISSLLYLQAQHSDLPALADLFRESQHRISSMALVNELLYQSDDYARIDFATYMRRITTSLFTSYGVDQRRVALAIEGQDTVLSINLAVPCGLIINEIVTNALKHAFPDGRAGRVEVRFAQRDDGMYVLDLSDDGIGSPRRPHGPAPTLGLRLVERLVRQLGGTLERRDGPGTAYRISFPPDGVHGQGGGPPGEG